MDLAPRPPEATAPSWLPWAPERPEAKAASWLPWPLDGPDVAEQRDRAVADGSIAPAAARADGSIVPAAARADGEPGQGQESGQATMHAETAGALPHGTPNATLPPSEQLEFVGAAAGAPGSRATAAQSGGAQSAHSEPDIVESDESSSVEIDTEALAMWRAVVASVSQ